MHDCPTCRQPGVTRLRKAFLGPALPAKCRACGALVGVPPWSIVVMLPWLALFIVLWNFPEQVGLDYPVWQRVVLSVLAVVTMVFVWDRFVPLQPRTDWRH